MNEQLDIRLEQFSQIEVALLAADLKTSRAAAAIEKVNVSDCNVETQEAAAQLLTVANEASRAVRCGLTKSWGSVRLCMRDLGPSACYMR
jgi:hypothetical protein